ncbi:unnamed protein product [Calypogeia fissa]
MKEKSSRGQEMESSTLSVQAPREKIALKLVRNVKRTDSRTIVVGATPSSGTVSSLLMEVQQAAAHKMRIPLTNLRLFNTRGEELSAADQDHAEAQIRFGGTLYVSAGEPCVMDKVPDQLHDDSSKAQVVVLAKESFVDAQALKQLKWAAALPGVVLGVGLPDLHVGGSCPIGATIASEGMIYPALVGSDIGCGMLLAKTSLKATAASKSRTVDRWAASLQLEGSWDGDISGVLAGAGVQATPFDSDSLGTVGRGNHFAELQIIESIEDAALAEKLGLSSEDVYLCVHSGSRGYGESILKTHTERAGSEGIPVESPEAHDYLAAHEQACKWAQVNRSVIATRFLEQLNDSPKDILLDITHNSVVEVEISNGDFHGKRLWLHRKGAAPSDKGPVVIPGSRGAFSYLVQPVEQLQFENSGWSLAHGAGRVLARSAARIGGKARHPNSNELTTTTLGSRVVCDDKALLYEERPEAYKDAACVVADLVSANLCTVVALLRPVLTYKMRSSQRDESTQSSGKTFK